MSHIGRRHRAHVPTGVGQVDELADIVVFLSGGSDSVRGSAIDWDQAVVGGSD